MRSGFFKALVTAAIVAAASFHASTAHAAQIGLSFTESGELVASALFGNDPLSLVIGVSVTPGSGVGEAWTFDFTGTGHSTDGGDFTQFGNNGVMTWYDLDAGKYNNLYFVDSTHWRLESDQLVAANLNNDGVFGIFNLGTSIYAGIDSYNGDQVFASVNEQAAPVPEPATLSLLGIGIAGLARRLRRRSA